jgi:homocitrate synthase NifV
VIKREVFLTDTTLRDGEQGCGFALKALDKLALAILLDDAGFYQIEAGIPAMGSCEKDAVCRIMDARKRAKIAVWNRMRKEDITHSFDCGPDIIHISAPVSDIMIHALIKKDREWVVKTLKDCVAYARLKGYAVTVGFQDASRADAAFMASLLGELQPLGVQSVRLADTVGILTPMRAHRLVHILSEQTDIPLGIHTHNDLGMAVAVAAEAVKGGAKFVDTTLFGIGERAGNCDPHKFAACIHSQFYLSPTLEDVQDLRASAMDILFPNGGKEAWV